MDALAHALGLPPSRIIVWFAPSVHELNDMILAPKQGRAPMPQFATARTFWRQVADHLAARGYHIVDPQDRVQGLYFISGIYPYSTSGHFRPEAYREVADMVAPVMRQILCDTLS